MSIRALAPAPTSTTTKVVTSSFTPTHAPLLLRKCACGGASSGGECDDCRKKKQYLQRHAASPSSPTRVPSIVQSVLRSPGRPLDPATRGFMESRFGHDFRQVRVHTDSQAAASARAVDAHAYTVGQDIVFAQGQYQPNSASGRHLLAHELAHTVQQRGLQRAAVGEVTHPESSLDARLEREAESAASAVMSSGTVVSSPPRLTRTGALGILSRSGPRRWGSVGGSPADRQIQISNAAMGTLTFQVSSRSNSSQDNGKGQPVAVAFFIDRFYLPRVKEQVINQYADRAKANALETTVVNEGRSIGPLREDRPGNPGVLWCQKHNWPLNWTGTLWHLAGGSPPAAAQSPPGPSSSTPPGSATPLKTHSNFPQLGNDVCEFDHIIELQLMGTNLPSNFQLMDKKANNLSGWDAIWPEIRDLASEIRNRFLSENREADIILHFREVKPAGVQTDETPKPCATVNCDNIEGKAKYCWQIECCAGHALAAAGKLGLAPAEPTTSGTDCKGNPAPGGVLYPLKTDFGAFDLEWSSRHTTEPIDICLDSTHQPTGARNAPARQLIPGLYIDRMTLASANSAKQGGLDRLEADIDVYDKARASRGLKIADQLGARVELKRETRGGSVGRVSLHKPLATVAFQYPFMSTVTLVPKLEGGRLTGHGKLTPSLPLLNRAPMTVELDGNGLRAYYGSKDRKFATPIPGVRITEARLGVELLPDFVPTGAVGFEVGPEGHPFLKGQLDASADSNGLVLEGNIWTTISGGVSAKGNASYRNRQWSGYVEMRAEDLGVPGNPRGQARLDFQSDGTLVAGGQITLDVADNTLTLSAKLEKGRLTFEGDGDFRLPGLKPLHAHVKTDGRHVEFETRTGVTIRAFSGEVTVRYRDGRWSADGTVDVEKGPAKGTATMHLSPAGRLYGEGRLRYAFTPNLVAEMGIALREDRSVHVTGEITLATIKLFDRFPREGGRKRLFKTHIGVPIFGFSLGPVGDVGLVLSIDPEIGVYYGIGPGELRDLKITTAFDPLADNPNVQFTAGAQLYIPFDAGFYLSIPAALSLSAVVASIKAGLDITADVGVRGAATTSASIQYQAQRWKLDLTPGLRVNPRLALRVDGFLLAEAGFGPFTTSAEKRWNLRSWEWGSNMTFGVEFPLKYDSAEGFQWPSFDNMRFIYPQDLSFSRLIGDIADRAQ